MIKNFILSKIEQKCSVDFNNIEDVKFFFQILKNNKINIQECHIQINTKDIFNEFLLQYCRIKKVYIYTNFLNIKLWKEQSKKYNFIFIYCINNFSLKDKENILNSDFTLLYLDPTNNLDIFIDNPNWILCKDIISKIYIEPNYLSLKWDNRGVEKYKIIIDTLLSAQLNFFAYDYKQFLKNFSIDNILNMPFYEKNNCVYINLIQNTIGFDKICSEYKFLSGINIDNSGIINIYNANMFLNMYILNSKKKDKNFFGLNAISSGDWMISQSFYFQLKNSRKEVIIYRFNQIERIIYK